MLDEESEGFDGCGVDWEKHDWTYSPLPKIEPYELGGGWFLVFDSTSAENMGVPTYWVSLSRERTFSLLLDRFNFNRLRLCEVTPHQL